MKPYIRAMPGGLWRARAADFTFAVVAPTWCEAVATLQKLVEIDRRRSRIRVGYL